MPEVLRDPFENLAAWTGSTTGCSIVAGGRNGNCLQVSTTAGGGTQTPFPVAAESEYVTWGFAWKVATIAGGTGSRFLTALRSDAGATAHLTFLCLVTGAIEVRRGSTTVGPVIGTSAAAVLTANAWNYIEIRARVHDTAGHVYVRVNGADVLTLDPVDTKQGGTKTVVDTVRIGNNDDVVTLYDDLYLRTGGGEAFLGDIGAVPAGRTVLLEPFTNLNAFAFTSGTVSIVAGGRNGTCLQTVGTGSSLVDFYLPPGPERSDTWTIGFAWRHTSAATGTRDILAMLADVGGANTQHNRLTYALSSTTLAWTRSSTTVASNAAVTLAQNTWYYIEVQCKLGDAPNGSVIVRVNGTEVINATGLDTKNSGTSTVYEELRLWCNASSMTSQYDDLYVKTGPGQTFSGDIGAVAEAGGPKLGRQSMRVAVEEPLPTDWRRLSRQSLRVAFQGATTSARVGGLLVRVLRRGGGGNARVGGMQVRVLRRYTTPPTSTVKLRSENASFLDAPVRTWTGSAYTDALSVRSWKGASWFPPLVPLTGLKLWLDADDASTFTYHSGTTVSQWNDKSGTNMHVNQTTQAWAPTRTAGVQNGRAAITPTQGTTLWRTTVVGAGLGDNVTTFVACKNVAGAPSSSVPVHIGYQSGNGFGIACRANHATNIGVLRANVDWITTATADPVAACVISTQRSASMWSQWLNGVATNMASTAGLNTNPIGVMIPSNAHYFTGHIYEVMHYERVLTTTERRAVEAYLKEKWGTP